MPACRMIGEIRSGPSEVPFAFIVRPSGSYHVRAFSMKDFFLRNCPALPDTRRRAVVRESF
jgi:hypothetical protein